ncbi:hypothetical protein BaRGS_00005732 [Batillaria attramentaria]|uniref:Uncharacterized protein n=1 Tax=Batillaria attramentaria TaxID=370345 RepID=A0ABD0LVB8_9CAEN
MATKRKDILKTEQRLAHAPSARVEANMTLNGTHRRRRYTLQVSGWKQSVDGNSYYILSLATGSSNVPNLFQTVNTGQCDVGGNCSGRCRQMNHFVSLVCLNMNGQLVIRLFEFNAYCSCQAAP